MGIAPAAGSVSRPRSRVSGTGVSLGAALCGSSRSRGRGAAGGGKAPHVMDRDALRLPTASGARGPIPRIERVRRGHEVGDESNPRRRTRRLPSPPRRRPDGTASVLIVPRSNRASAQAVAVIMRGYCQVDAKLVDRPPRYWARASREPAMLGIKNGRRPQLDNTLKRCLAREIYQRVMTAFRARQEIIQAA